MGARSIKCRFCGGADGLIVSEEVDTGHRAVTRFNRGDGRQRYVKVHHHQVCRDEFEAANAESFRRSQLEMLDDIAAQADAIEATDPETAAKMRAVVAKHRSTYEVADS